MKIIEWYARVVAAGIAPDWYNITAIYNPHESGWYLSNCTFDDENNQDWGDEFPTHLYMSMNFRTPLRNKEGYLQDWYIPLRKDGVDLVELWTKEDIPTEKDKRKEVYLKLSYGIIRGNLNIINKTKEGVTIYGIWNGKENLYTYHCLLANNGNIAPKPEDFEKVYGEI